MSGAAATGIVERDSYSGKQEDDGAGGQVLGAMSVRWQETFDSISNSEQKVAMKISLRGLSTETALQVALLL